MEIMEFCIDNNTYKILEVDEKELKEEYINNHPMEELILQSIQ